MSFWYHVAGFASSWFIDTKNTKDVTVYLGALKEEFTMTAANINE